jgi:nicotinate-nucleotide adenylyltransferase
LGDPNVSENPGTLHPISARLSTRNDPKKKAIPTMRLGLFGGTFDPIHLGHLIVAEQCREACGLDRVWFVVAGAPPHKLGERTAVAHRLEMARIAVAGHPAFEVSEIETSRPGPHYSVETLEAVHVARPGDDLFFLIGADSLADLPHWRQPERIARLATLVVVNRPGIDPAATAAWPDLGPDARPMLSVTIPPIGIASHDLRRRLAEGRSIRYLVPRGVEAYVEAQGLYRQEDCKVPISRPR